MDRRTFAKTALAAPMVVACDPPASVSAPSKANDPLPDLVKEWRAINAICNDVNVDMSDEDPRMTQEHALSLQICKTQPTTLEGAESYLEWVLLTFGCDIHGSWGQPYSDSLDTLYAGLRGIREG